MKSKKPTRYQRQFLEERGLDPHVWYIQKDSSTEVQAINIKTQEVKILPKR